MFYDVNEEAEALRIRFLGNAGGLTGELASICLIKTKLVYKVFQILDVNATIHTGFAFLDKAHLLLSLLSYSKDGLILCQQLYKWLTELSLSKTVMQPKFASNNDFNLRLLKSVINTAQPPTETTKARKLSDIEMDWYANYNSSPIALKSGARNKFDSDVCWMLPTSGIGFVIYMSQDS